MTPAQSAAIVCVVMLVIMALAGYDAFKDDDAS